MAGFYEAMTISIVVSAVILVGLLIYQNMKGDDFDDFTH